MDGDGRDIAVARHPFATVVANGTVGRIDFFHLFPPVPENKKVPLQAGLFTGLSRT